jgi:hypothetical protein
MIIQHVMHQCSFARQQHVRLQAVPTYVAAFHHSIKHRLDSACTTVVEPMDMARQPGIMRNSSAAAGWLYFQLT